MAVERPSAGKLWSESPNTYPAAGTSLDRRKYPWRMRLWALLYPARTQRVQPTLPGWMLILLSMGIGTAAYNSANNILFLTLSLLLGCLVLSGILSGLNFRGVDWELNVAAPLRTGQSHPVTLQLINRKRWLPSYGLWFECEYTAATGPVQVRAPGRLETGQTEEIVWSVTPQRRGIEKIRLSYVGSLFPFGFLRKSLVTQEEKSTLVWPAPIEYRRYPAVSRLQLRTGAALHRRGQGVELWGLRDYRLGDPRRAIHWKTSARTGRLMVRENSTESQEGVSLWLQAKSPAWSRPAQFELACSLVATLAEDLFMAGQLQWAILDDQEPIALKALRDLELFLDQVALLTLPSTTEGSAVASGKPRFRNLLVVLPDGANQVAAYLNGEKAAST